MKRCSMSLSYPSSKVKSAFKSPLANPVNGRSVSTDDSHTGMRQCDSGTSLVASADTGHLVDEPRTCVKSGLSPMAASSDVSTPRSRKHMQGKSASFRTPFWSPAQAIVQKAPRSEEEEFEELVKRETTLDTEIASLQHEGLSVDELDVFIDKLHRYNDIKDAAQIVLGKLAELEGVAVKEIYKRYNVVDTE